MVVSRVSFRGEVISARFGRTSNSVRGDLHPGRVDSCVKRSGIGRGLSICVRTTENENRTLSRILLCNPPKLKGAALTNVVTGRVNMGVEVADNPTVRGRNSLTTLLAGLRRNSILFVSRVRHLGEDIRRILCPTVRSETLSVVVNGKPSTESVELSLPGFALINTAAHTNRLSTPLESEFNIVVHLRLCAPRRLTVVIGHDTSVLNVSVSSRNTTRVTTHSEKAPHVTGELLGQDHSFTRIGCGNIVAHRTTTSTLSEVRISRLKLSTASEELLATVVGGCGNNPMNLRAVTTTVNRRTMAVRSICRPCLVRVKFLDQAPEKEYTSPTTCGRLNFRRSNRRSLV